MLMFKFIFTLLLDKTNPIRLTCTCIIFILHWPPTPNITSTDIHTVIMIILTAIIIIIDQYWYDHYNHGHYHHCHRCCCCCQVWGWHHFKLAKQITAGARQEIALGHCKDRGYLNMSELPHRHSTAAHFYLWVSPTETYIMAVVNGFSVTLPFPSPWLGFNVTLIAIAWLSPQIEGNHAWMEMRLSSVIYTHQTTGRLTKRAEERLRATQDEEEEEEACGCHLYWGPIINELIWKHQW